MPENHSTLKDTSQVNSSQPEWIIFGAGRIGKGLVNLIASEHDFKTTLISQNPPTDAEALRISNTKSYNIRLFDDIHSKGVDKKVNFSQFQTKDQSLTLIDKISNSNVEIVSTSVGFKNLDSVAEIISQGIKKRILKGVSKKLHILIFENGLSNNSRGKKNAPEYFISILTNKLKSENVDINQILNHINIPNLIFDCYIPNLPKNNGENIVKEKGNIWIEDNEESKILLKKLPRIHHLINLHIVSSSEMHSYHYLKHFGFNSLNVMYALVTLITKNEYIDQAINRVTKSYFDEIKRSIILAIPLASKQAPSISQSYLQDYCNYCHSRLMHKPGLEWFENTRDSIDRIYHKILGNNYSDDIRIFGPLKYLLENSNIKLSEEETHFELYDMDGNIFFVAHKSLIHIISIYFLIDMKVHEYKEDIRSVIFNRNILYDCFDIKNSIGNTKIEIFVAKEMGYIDIKSGSKEEWLVNALSDNIRYLCEKNDYRQDNHLNFEDLEEYLKQEIEREEIKIHRNLSISDLKLVVFDLDEGIVNSESTLFDLTNEIIREQSQSHYKELEIDQYSKYIGASENDFFDILRNDFNFRSSYTVQDFISDRDEKYLIRLQNGVSSVAYKPGFLGLLKNLRDNNVKFAINSNASRNRLNSTLTHINCGHYFDEESSILCSTDRNMEAKPSSIMIKTTLRKHDIKAKNCLVIESTNNGLKAARDAGCFCIMIANDFSDPQTLRLDQRGKIVFDNMLHLRACLKRAWGHNQIPIDL